MKTLSSLKRDNAFWSWLEKAIEDYSNTGGEKDDINAFRRRIFNYISRYYKYK